VHCDYSAFSVGNQYFTYLTPSKVYEWLDTQLVTGSSLILMITWSDKGYVKEKKKSNTCQTKGRSGVSDLVPNICSSL
jgi:hypothetical protein